ncbi:S26 family signal peptidase [bacterium SCSIO 12741]|nr:S26 family signal peptidase [bacterium SCSIO 12741]
MTIAIYLIITLAMHFGLYLLFEKAGRKGWEALVPVYNLVIWLQIMKKPWWWLLLLIFPGVNILMIMVMSFNLAVGFGKRGDIPALLSFFVPFVYLPMIGMDKKTTFQGYSDTPTKRTAAVEWRDAIIFAIVAASIIRTYVFEAYTIPSSSMEKSLLVGDYLFVSKVAYGPKSPKTPLAIPFVHHSIPFTNAPSYLEWMKLPHFRLPGLGDVERNDVVVFNFPAGDTVCLEQQNRSYYDILSEYQQLFGKEQGRDYLYNGMPRKYWNDGVRMMMQQGMPRGMASKVVQEGYSITARPVDKRENYVKRCVAIAGDTLQIKNGILYINGEEGYVPPLMQYKYFVNAPHLNKRTLKSDFGISFEDYDGGFSNDLGKVLPMPLHVKEKMDKLSSIKGIEPQIKEPGTGIQGSRIFPNDPAFPWNEDNFGPLWIPKKGETIALTLKELPKYRRIIGVFEENDLSVADGKIYINGEEATEYTFKMNYYYLIGDNRHNSLDSRFWGFVPEDHVVGKASFIWMSLDKDLGWFDGKVRTERIFRWIE